MRPQTNLSSEIDLHVIHGKSAFKSPLTKGQNFARHKTRPMQQTDSPAVSAQANTGDWLESPRQRENSGLRHHDVTLGLIQLLHAS